MGVVQTASSSFNQKLISLQQLWTVISPQLGLPSRAVCSISAGVEAIVLGEYCLLLLLLKLAVVNLSFLSHSHGRRTRNLGQIFNFRSHNRQESEDWNLPGTFSSNCTLLCFNRLCTDTLRIGYFQGSKKGLFLKQAIHFLRLEIRKLRLSFCVTYF